MFAWGWCRVRMAKEMSGLVALPVGACCGDDVEGGGVRGGAQVGEVGLRSVLERGQGLAGPLAKKEVAEDRAEVAVGSDGDGEEWSDCPVSLQASSCWKMDSEEDLELSMFWAEQSNKGRQAASRKGRPSGRTWQAHWTWSAGGRKKCPRFNFLCLRPPTLQQQHERINVGLKTWSAEKSLHSSSWAPFDNIVRREISTHNFRMATVFLVTGPICPLALPGTIFSHHATCADKQLRPGKLISTTMTGANFGDLLSGGPVQLLQTGAGEALGNEFDYVAAVTIRQPVACLTSPSDRHIPVGERAA
ncbi:hypothetical protein THAOC_02070 [Thalassiosira oceanica]|uniref:Uncharacterized protein n=1 Tax=Thalassiosira oceanica TaxID=159749 RepID=K0TFU4_THAOC|nr:hypothetical protein THAOC_02070 [Thalassiosira oceanica]|eukprot:EJK76185.1 hypothetical protein THAOC_02070 [Thalassiosira oceanica]